MYINCFKTWKWGICLIWRVMPFLLIHYILQNPHVFLRALHKSISKRDNRQIINFWLFLTQIQNAIINSILKLSLWTLQIQLAIFISTSIISSVILLCSKNHIFILEKFNIIFGERIIWLGFDEDFNLISLEMI